jgi:hypothetical protein
MEIVKHLISKSLLFFDTFQSSIDFMIRKDSPMPGWNIRIWLSHEKIGRVPGGPRDEKSSLHRRYVRVINATFSIFHLISP